MALSAFFNSDVYTWAVLPLLIFLARIVDVSMDTVRVIFITRGYKRLAPIIGFFEILVWLLAIRQILLNLTNIMAFIGYATGFATGTYVGIIIENKLSIGNVMLRITSRTYKKDLIKSLRETRHFVTSSHADGPKGKVMLIHLTIPRHDVTEIIQIIKKHDPRAVYTIEDVRSADEPIPLKIPNILHRAFYRRNGK